MTDLSEVFERAKQRELEQEEQAKVVPIQNYGLELVIDEGRLTFESKKDSCV